METQRPAPLVIFMLMRVALLRAVSVSIVLRATAMLIIAVY
jgi:hypothetical protein